MTRPRTGSERMIRTLIADDEPLARRGLELRLAGEPDIRIVGQVGDGAAAVRAVSEHAPDLLFLDVQMPGLDGFATLRAIPARQMPLVVFVTAYDHYAINAFETNAVDYLLKPVDDSRLHQALFRVREMLDRREASEHRARLLGLLGAISGRPALTLDEALERTTRGNCAIPKHRWPSAMARARCGCRGPASAGWMRPAITCASIPTATPTCCAQPSDNWRNGWIRPGFRASIARPWSTPRGSARCGRI